MKTWTQLALAFTAAAGLMLVTLGYSRRLDGELLAAAQIAELESIPVLGEQ